MDTPLTNARVLLGVSASIAAYKAAELASRLQQEGARLDVILTADAQRFISVLTFKALTHGGVYTDEDWWQGPDPLLHIHLAQGLRALVIAPATADLISDLAHGKSDRLLTATALAAGGPLLLAPAMDGGMYAHPATQDNLALLRAHGAILLGPAQGHLASGLVSLGRMSEPEEILGELRWQLAQGGPLAGRNIVVTAGGTQEPIDSARIITNRSSGKQGYALAQAALDAGAMVTLISAPTSLSAPYGANVVRVRTAEEMQERVLQSTIGADALLMAAAVSDFRPEQGAGQKIKREAGPIHLVLEPTEDILRAVAERRTRTGFPRAVIGFAAEDRDLIENAAKKVNEKSLEFIVANDISAADAGFEVDTNRVSLVFPDGHIERWPLMSKEEVATRIVSKLAGLLQSVDGG